MNTKILRNSLLEMTFEEEFIISKFWSFFFFSFLSQFTGQQGKGNAIFLIPLYLFYMLHSNLDSNWAITATSSPLHIASNHTRTENLWFPSANHKATRLKSIQKWYNTQICCYWQLQKWTNTIKHKNRIPKGIPIELHGRHSPPTWGELVNFIKFI